MNEQYVDKDIELFPPGKLFRLLYDNVMNKFRILCRDSYDNRKLVDYFSDTNPTYYITRQYGMKSDERLYAVNSFGYFQTGLVFEVFKYIAERHGGLGVLAMSQNVLNYINHYLRPLYGFAKSRDRSSFTVSNISSSIEMRDYQTEIVKSIIFDGFGRGLFESPTGSGKSFTIANLIYTIQQQYDSSYNFLIFVPNSQLVTQFKKDLLDYGFPADMVKMISGSLSAKERKAQPKNPKIIISNRQYICKHKDELPKIDVLIADEVHTLASDSSKCFSFVADFPCSMKIGCSGTIPRDKIQKWNLIGLFSKILYTEDVVHLQDRGFLSKLKIKSINVVDRYVQKNRSLLFHPNSTTRYSEDGEIAFNDAYIAEKEYTDANYVKLFYPVLEQMKKCNGNVMVLFDRLEFGKNIYSFVQDDLKQSNPDIEVMYVDGSTKIDRREEIRQKMEQSSNNILFAEVVVMGTGINIKNLPNIVFMFSGKSLSRVIQSIGRSLRTHKDKEEAILIDTHFNFKYSTKHYKERKKLYKEFYGKSEPDDEVNVEV